MPIDCAFRGCSGLTSVTIPDGVTSIGGWAFESCSGLTNIIIPDGVTIIGAWVFNACTKLTSIIIPDNVTNIRFGAFSNCSGLTNINIPDSVTSIEGDAFHYCYNLTDVTMGTGITSIKSNAFEGCNRITNIYTTDLAAWCKISGLRDLMGYGSSNKNLYLNGSIVTDLTIPDGAVNIESYAFYNCRGLTSIKIPDSVTYMGSSVFSGCDNLIEKSNGIYYVDKWVIGVVNKSITTAIIKEGTRGIASCSFGSPMHENNYCRNLTTVKIPQSVVSICSYSFSFCYILTDITIPDGVTSIGSFAFQGCSGLTSITIPDSVTSIGYWAFEGCSNLTSVIIGSGVTSIGESAFESSGLKTVFYKGTAEQWNQISIDYPNRGLSTTRYYYSETEPSLNWNGTAYDGNFWHYDSDGKTPLIWKKEI